MRIGIEAQRLFRPQKHGMDRVALEFINHLQQIDKVNEYFIFVKPDVDNQIISNTQNFKIVEIKGGPYPIWEQFKLPKQVKAYKCDVLHCTSNSAPLYSKIPIITTLHDIIYKETSLLRILLGRASWYQKLGSIYRRLIVSRVIGKSKKLITVSHYERNNIQSKYNLENNKIRTIHNGVSKKFFAKIDEHLKEEIKKKYKLPDKFLLHIGNTDPRKNTARVFESFQKFTKTTNKTTKLVVIGLNREKVASIVRAVPLDPKIYQKIICPGYIADDDLPYVYSLAQMFLFPSLREGFGIPILEAMACGVPVITSNVSSMPEVAGDAACLVDPKSTTSLVKAIKKIDSDTYYKNELIQKGLHRHTLFSWEKMSNDILKIYKEFNL